MDLQCSIANDIQALAERHRQMANELGQMAKSNDYQRIGRELGQRRLREFTQATSKQLLDTEKRLVQDPLELELAKQTTQTARKAAELAGQQMSQSIKEIKNGQSDPAAASTEQAHAQLESASAEAAAAAALLGSPQSPIPENVAQQVMDAKQLLSQTDSQLSKQRSPSNANGSQKQAGQQEGEQSNGEASEGDSGENGNEQPNSQSLDQQASDLSRASEALSEAVRDLQPKKGDASSSEEQNDPMSGDANSDDSSQPGPAEGDQGTGAALGIDLQELETELLRAAARNWGQLPGHLRTEIFQASQRKTNGQYARLIKLYFKDLATTPNP